jgi:hypothetical protein
MTSMAATASRKIETVEPISMWQLSLVWWRKQLLSWAVVACCQNICSTVVKSAACDVVNVADGDPQGARIASLAIS